MGRETSCGVYENSLLFFPANLKLFSKEKVFFQWYSKKRKRERRRRRDGGGGGYSPKLQCLTWLLDWVSVPMCLLVSTTCTVLCGSPKPN